LAAILPSASAKPSSRTHHSRFVDSYVVDTAPQPEVHAVPLPRSSNLLQREALLTVTARALEIVTRECTRKTIAKPSRCPSGSLSVSPEISRRTHAPSALERQRRPRFQSDLKMYEDLIARAASSRRPRKPFEAANHPFVDRCGFVLDSSFLEKLASPPAAPSRIWKPSPRNRGVHPQRNFSIRPQPSRWRSTLNRHDSIAQITRFSVLPPPSRTQYLRHSCITSLASYLMHTIALAPCCARAAAISRKPLLLPFHKLGQYRNISTDNRLNSAARFPARSANAR